MLLFPEIEPYRTFRLPVSDLHTLYVEESGNPDGAPAVFFHGGPGAGISPMHRRFFDPKFWRVILFDQRGCGQSTPLGELSENTTWHLVADAEKIRAHLGIAKWLVFGGSWGSTMGLAYAETHPERVTGLVLRGIFLGRKLEIDWTFADGLRRMEPEGWDAFVAPLTPRERGSIVRAYYRRLTSDDALQRREAALAWNKFENHASKLVPVDEPVAEEDVPKEIALARIEAHYFLNDSFLKSDDQLLRDAERLRRIPGVIVQGKYDLVCPIQSAWDLHLAWPEAKYVVVPDAGHAADEPGIVSALVEATEDFRRKA
ncbi:MAG TPA: prolyl aminopeptidase [Thermoanaerobaculia bacterium]|nr:prolyl aminopeptidase [Thermoanaerobaculia bacterium]